MNVLYITSPLNEAYWVPFLFENYDFYRKWCSNSDLSKLHNDKMYFDNFDKIIFINAFTYSDFNQEVYNRIFKIKQFFEKKVSVLVTSRELYAISSNQHFNKKDRELILKKIQDYSVVTYINGVYFTQVPLNNKVMDDIDDIINNTEYYKKCSGNNGINDKINFLFYMEEYEFIYKKVSNTSKSAFITNDDNHLVQVVTTYSDNNSDLSSNKRLLFSSSKKPLILNIP